MTSPRTDFPPVRACLFDMDGLLINTEDIYTLCHNLTLASYSAGPMTWDIKSQLQGRPASESIALLLRWFKLENVVSAAEYTTELHAIQEREFLKAAPLPGVEEFLTQLRVTNREGKKMHIALATISHEGHFKLKTTHLSELFEVFQPARRVLGDDPRILKGRGKPSPDIYLVALKAINETLEDGEEEVKPAECLVFEDGVPGVIAGRRAGMRVIWIPHEGLAKEYRGREAEVLAGRAEGAEIDTHQLGEVNDGWAEQMTSLVNFPYAQYGIATSR